jgi:hypothetical protein
MDFAAIIVFLILYYIRPQEWIGFVAELTPVKWSIVFALITMVGRKRGFHVRELIQTPHDWMMLLYLLWIIGSNVAAVDTFFNNYNLFIYYIVTVQALSSATRAQTFLSWWTFMIMVVAALAVAAEYGFDLVGSSDLTHGIMKDRLVFNTSIFNNPNALGHSVFPAVFLLYFLLFWKRPVFIKIFTVPLTFLPFYCVYLTESKGAFIGAFATIIAALTFGRPKVVQIMILVGAMTVGWTMLWSMPRMGELNKASTDQAIQGRVAAFTYGLHTLKNNFHGIGIHQFPYGVERAYGFKKAAHSSYVQVGGELGWPGLFLFVGIMYCCLRTLFSAKTTDATEERVRRILFVLLVSYAVSSWMVNWPWRGTFFMLIGAIAAFHRLMLAKRQPAQTETELQTETDPVPAIAGLQPVPALAPATPATFNQTALILPVEKEGSLLASEHAESELAGLHWNKLGWVDLLMMIGLTWVTIRLWQYLITKM